jgi:hypothetical protein
MQWGHIHKLISGFSVTIHPNVYSPKYFPESKWYGQDLEKLIVPVQDFLGG